MKNPPLNMVFFFTVQNIDKIPLVKCPVLVIHVSNYLLIYTPYLYESLFSVGF